MSNTLQDLDDAIAAVNATVTQLNADQQTLVDAANAAATRVSNLPSPVQDFSNEVAAINQAAAGLAGVSAGIASAIATVNGIAPTPAAPTP